MSPVRPAVPADAEAAVEVVRRSIVELCVADHCNDAETLAQWIANKTVEQFRAWISSQRHCCIVAEDESGICGVGLAFYQRHGYRSAGDAERGFGITRPIPYAKDI